MTGIYLALATWTFVGVVIIAITIASPPWMHTLSEWKQITIMLIAGPVAWICIAFFAFRMLMDGESVSQRSAAQKG